MEINELLENKTKPIIKRYEDKEMFVIKLPLVVNKIQEDILNKKFNETFFIANKVMKIIKNRVYQMEKDSDYKLWKQRYGKTNSKIKKLQIEEISISKKIKNYKELNINKDELSLLKNKKQTIKDDIKALKENLREIGNTLKKYQEQYQVPKSQQDSSDMNNIGYLLSQVINGYKKQENVKNGLESQYSVNQHKLHMHNRQNDMIKKRIWQKVEKYLYGNGKHLFYFKKDEISQLYQDSRQGGISLKQIDYDNWEVQVSNKYISKNALKKLNKRNESLSKAKQKKLKNVSCSIKVRNINNDYVLNALNNCEIHSKLLLKEPFNTGYKYFLSVTLSGNKPKKKNHNGDVKFKNVDKDAIVGIDMGVSEVAITTIYKDMAIKNVECHKLINNEHKYEKILKNIDRQLERSRFINNPECYKVDGQKIKNKKIKKFSKNYKKKIQLKHSLERKKKENIKNCHNKIHNLIIDKNGININIEDMQFNKIQKKPKTEKEQKLSLIKDKNKNVKLVRKTKKKIKLGKSINRNSPGLFVSELKKKVETIGGNFNKINTYSTKLSQYNHINDDFTKVSLNQRTKKIGNYDVSRDMYSSLLIACTKDNKLNKKHVNDLFEDFMVAHDICKNNLEKEKKYYNALGK